MDRKEIENFEINQLTEAINFRYGYNFQNYARASLRRRILHRMNDSHLESISEMIPRIIHDPDFFALFLKDMSVTVTEMFRDPQVYKKIKDTVFTYLKTYPRLNIWHAGCATGEEVYSMAILLKEADLQARTHIYATDYNHHSLEIARNGIYPAKKMRSFTENYLAAGGEASFGDYYNAKYKSAKMDESLAQNITFANHNLVNDGVFAQMHLIVCRNVLIYFNKTLQNRVLNLFQESLVPRGFLVLGDKEHIKFSNVQDSFEVWTEDERIFRKKNEI